MLDQNVKRGDLKRHSQQLRIVDPYAVRHPDFQQQDEKQRRAGAGIGCRCEPPRDQPDEPANDDQGDQGNDPAGRRDVARQPAR